MHTSSWIVDKCFRGDLVKDRTVIIVVYLSLHSVERLVTSFQTHNIAMVGPVSKFVVALGLDGRIASQGTLERVLANDSKLRAELAKEKEVIAKGEEVVDDPTKETKPKDDGKGKLVVSEEVALGRVSWPAREHHMRLAGSG